jgi:hypothetical protein
MKLVHKRNTIVHSDQKIIQKAVVLVDLLKIIILV